MSSSEQLANGSGVISESIQYTGQIRNITAVYNVYRLVLPIVLMLTYVSSSGSGVLGVVNPTLFLSVALSCLVFAIAAMIASGLRPLLTLDSRYQTGTHLFDVLALSLLVYSCGGIVSGLALLLIVNVASASILIRGRLSYFIAAIASLATIYAEVYLTLDLDSYTGQFLQAGILGAILFGATYYIQTASNRAFEAARLAEEQASSIIDLEKLNNEIIQRMRTGIMVVNRGNEVIAMNNAARSLLEPILESETTDGKTRDLLPDMLRAQIDNWRNTPLSHGDVIKIPGTRTSLQTSFAFLNNDSDSDILVFIENQSRFMQRIRQTKLASLGRLSANIAHEIRNPLGAISHAGQILEESETLSTEERRMLDIILTHSQRVNRIITDVLDISRHKEVAPARIDLQTWLKEFVDQYEESQGDCDKIDLEFEDKKIQIRAIQSQLERVFTNLFDNGLRYSRKATGAATLQVRVGVRSTAGDKEQAFVSIIDKGPGLDEEAESQLFEPFHTTESTGTGLGLYISKELCEANQATLDYSITDSGNSCFTIGFNNFLSAA